MTLARAERWPVSKIAALIAIEQRAESCWRVRKYLGSMLAFDFGGRQTRAGVRGSYEKGTSSLGVRDCSWTFTTGTESLTSDAADGTTGARLDEALRGAVLAACERRGTDLVFAFSNSAILSLDLTNRYKAEPDEAIASLQLSGGAFFELMPGGRFVLITAESEREREGAAA